MTHADRKQVGRSPAAFSAECGAVGRCEGCEHDTEVRQCLHINLVACVLYNGRVPSRSCPGQLGSGTAEGNLQDACTKHIPLWAAAVSALLRLSHFDGDTISLGVEIVKGRVHRIGSLREGSSSSNVSGAGLPAWRGTLPCQGGRAKPGKRGGASPSPTPLYG